MTAGWVSEAWLLGGSLDGFLRHGHWVGFRGMAAGSLDGVTLSTGFRGF